MSSAPIPPDEPQRLYALRRYGVLDTAAEQAFDDLVHLASQICAAPIALISLVDSDRTWIKAKTGLAAQESPRDVSFCAHAILDAGGVLQIPDALLDSRFAANPFVTDAPWIRFYAGAPLVTPDRRAIGSMCVVDTEPRSLTPDQTYALRALARQAVALLEMRRVEAERAEALHALDRVFTHALDMLCIMTREGWLTRLNPAFTEILGWSSEELQARPMLAFVHPEDHDRTRLELARLAQGRATLNFHNRWRRRDGAYRWFAWKCAPTPEGLFYASARDVTDEIFIEEELQKSEERFRMVVEAAPHALVMIDESGSMTLVNSETERLFGYDRSELLGRPVELLVPERFRAAQIGLSAHYGASSTGAPGRVLYGRRKDGVETPIEVGLSPLITADGEFVLASIIDITERRKVERLKTEFISVVSHELRTPLTSIRGSLGLIAAGAAGELPPKARQMLDLAWRNSDRLAGLINDLLDFEKLEMGQIPLETSLCSLHQLVAQALAANSGYAAATGVSIELAPDSIDAQVSVDPGRLTQVLANLLSNAVKFSAPGQTVRVAIHSRAEEVRVTVRDEGPGVPADFQPRMFQRFSQADASDGRRKGGAGLGLAISKALIERMKGCIGFESTAGAGATFWFDLPIAAHPVCRRVCE